MLKSFQFLLWIGLLLSSQPALSRDVPLEGYGYPITNPFEATIAGTPDVLQGLAGEKIKVTEKDYSLLLRPERAFEVPSIFWPVKKFTYRLAYQPKAAPLIFIIVGTGSHYDSSLAEYLKRLFYKQGFHVVQITSPTNYDFIVGASRHATPGISTEDAKDLYQVMQSIRAQQHQLPITDFYLTGYSLGALEAAFVSHLDETRKSFNFKKVMLLNTPVNLLTSVDNLDKLVTTQVEGINSDTNFYQSIFDKLSKFFEKRGHVNLDAAMLFDFQQSKERLNNEQLAMLIGAAFRFASTDIVFTSDLVNKRGKITPLGTEITYSTHLEPFFRKALVCDFICYVETQVIPYWHSIGGKGSIDDLAQQVGLYAIEDYLRTSPKIGAMHNADDIILGEGDLGFLRRTLGDRLTVYPLGGHCGNISYHVNSNDLVEFFRD